MNKSRKTYGVLNNIKFMLEKAYRIMPSVIVMVVVLPILQVGIQTSQLLFTPSLLRAIEARVDLSKLILMIAGFSLLLIVLNIIYSYIRENVMYGRIEVRLNILGDISRKIGSTSYPNLYKGDFQKLRDRSMVALSSNSSPGENIWETMSLILESLLGISVYLIFMREMELWIIALTVATSILSFLSTKYINEWGYRNRHELGDISKNLEYITNLGGDSVYAKDVRIFNMKPWLNEVYSGFMRLYRNFISKEQRIYLLGDSIDLVLSLLKNGLAYGYIVRIALRGSIGPASFILLFNAINGFTDWTGKLLNEVNALYKESLELSSVRELLGYREEFLFEEGEPLEPDIDKVYSIELRNVSLKYEGASEYSLKNINLLLEKGEKLAIVGLNGAGKTSLVKLMVGLYDPTEGEVLLNGRDIRSYNRRDIYKHFTAVFQDFSILAGTIYENVSQAKGENIDIALVDQCIEIAGLTEKISSLPEAGNTKLVRSVYEDGIDLSGGEMQRLMLARALYKNAPILILDEPTAALDPIAENNIYLQYNNMTEGKTSVFISHRLASTRFCDRIVFLNKGEILEEGSHEELLARNGSYRNLFDVQSKYYKEKGGEEDEEQNKKY